MLWLRADAIELGFRDIAVVYGQSAIRLGMAAIEAELAKLRSAHDLAQMNLDFANRDVEDLRGALDRAAKPKADAAWTVQDFRAANLRGSIK